MIEDNRAKLLRGFETHSVELIQEALASGIDVNGATDEKSPLTELIEMYYRSPSFSTCVRCLVESGAVHQDKALLAVLMDDSASLAQVLQNTPGIKDQTVNIHCPFTPLKGASLLHVACEFGLLNAAKTLIHAGADIEARAAVDTFGFNGHTPIFHTVCQHRNHSLPLLRLLLENGAKADVRLSGITWGKGHPWETTLFDPTPVSYAQAGLLPQFQRNEVDVYENIRLLIQSLGRSIPGNLNVPNAYLL